mmetsp:Transcript_17294/g.26194  ORF Transcript_17294/g.26194 Transcript_17294/m.26194 type:complete len:519 (+) Transcript_17294:2-1558(+)
MGLAVLFKLGDDDSIARHLNDRRDFTLLNSSDFEHNDKYCSKETISKNSNIETSPPSKQQFSLVTKSSSNESTDCQISDDSRVQLSQGRTNSSNESPDCQTPDNTTDKSNANEKDGSLVETEKKNLEIESLDVQAGTKNENMKKKLAKNRAKKGFSVKERKLIKKYGSLEAAEEIIAERELKEKLRKKVAKNSESSQNLEPQIEHKRGKQGKMKKAAKKYADQDDEDRELAFLALHGGEKKGKKEVPKMKDVSEVQERAAAETKSLLVHDASKVAEALPADVKVLLAKCVTNKTSEEEESVRWDKYDADVLETFKGLDSSEQVAAATRLLNLKTSSRVDNFSASLAGIIRTIERYGHLDSFTNDKVNADARRKTKAEKEKEKKDWKETLAAEGIVNEDLDEDGLDDTVELGKLSGRPVANDSLLHAVPICAPYQTLSQYKYRVKLTPGNLKRGKAAKQCVDLFTHQNEEKTPHVERMRDLIRRLTDNDWVQVMCSDVKISSAGGNKSSKSQKKKGKRK